MPKPSLSAPSLPAEPQRAARPLPARGRSELSISKKELSEHFVSLQKARASSNRCAAPCSLKLRARAGLRVSSPVLGRGRMSGGRRCGQAVAMALGLREAVGFCYTVSGCRVRKPGLGLDCAHGWPGRAPPGVRRPFHAAPCRRLLLRWASLGWTLPKKLCVPWRRLVPVLDVLVSNGSIWGGLEELVLNTKRT